MNNYLKKIANPGLFFFCCLWLMILLVVGTIIQKDIGLYQAQVQYFSSWVIWLGPIPLPGGVSTIVVIFAGLLCQLIFKTKWTLKKLGISIAHMGSLLLLFGGFLTGQFSNEGSMIIPEGESVGFYQDYHKLELAIVDITDPAQDTHTVFGEGLLEKGNILKHESIPLTITVLNFYQNCHIQMNKGAATGRVGMAKNIQFSSKKLEVEDSQNRACLEFEVKGSETEGIYSVLEFMSIPQTIKAKGRTFVVEIRGKRYPLPFAIKLNDFERKNHAATSMAKSYKADIVLKDGELEQRTVIQMNEPLRYKGHTFYQSSFIQGETDETTILAVVKNIGRPFPYVSSIIICIGLLIHLLVNSGPLFKKREHNV